MSAAAGMARPYRILSIDGGGCLGATSAGFLAETERHFGKTCHERFSMFAGTSTGAIIAAALAIGKSAAEVVDFYRTLGARVFWNPVPGTRALRVLRGVFTSRYSAKRLAGELRDVFGEQTIGSVERDHGKRLLITAFNVSTGTPRVFKTDKPPQLTRDSNYRLVDVVLASTAAPVYLPLAAVKAPHDAVHEKFADGGLVAKNPSLLAFAEAVTTLQQDAGNVHLLSVSTPHFSIAESVAPLTWMERLRLRRGLIGWQSTIADKLMSANTEIHHQLLLRLLQAGRYHRILFQSERRIAIDDGSARAISRLCHLGTERATLSDTRTRLEHFFV